MSDIAREAPRDENTEDRLRQLPELSPSAELSSRLLAPPMRARSALPLPLAPRAALVLTVLAYLGWAFRAAALLGH